MDSRMREAVRYLGYGTCAVDESTLQLIRNSFRELEQLKERKIVYRIFEVTFPNEGTILINKTKIESLHLYNNLKGCEKVIVFGATLGASVDRLLRKYEVIDMAHAVVLQACAASLLEEFCDEIQEKLASEYEKEHLFLRPRFSPGYGDFSVLYQKDILTMLESSKTIGLTMTSACMLTPTKSVTAVIGVSSKKEACHKKGCEECSQRDCAYRRSE